MPSGIYIRKPHSEETKRKIGLANSISLKGKKLPESVKDKMRKSSFSRGRKENESTGWKGNCVNYVARHSRIYRRYGMPTQCEECKTDGLVGRKIHWANISGKYLLDRGDWKRLCAKCHKLFDKGTKGRKIKTNK